MGLEKGKLYKMWKISMKNFIAKNWQTIRIIMINWSIFALGVSSLAVWTSIGEIQGLNETLGQCEANWDRLGKKIENGEVVIKTEQTINFDKQGVEVKP